MRPLWRWEDQIVSLFLFFLLFLFSLSPTLNFLPLSPKDSHNPTLVWIKASDTWKQNPWASLQEEEASILSELLSKPLSPDCPWIRSPWYAETSHLGKGASDLSHCVLCYTVQTQLALHNCWGQTGCVKPTLKDHKECYPAHAGNCCCYNHS